MVRSRGPATPTLRLIGGEWRGRRISIADAPGLRPTGDRIRETLFNWLAPRIQGARCIDLFAGSGALGLEALSRGAAHVDFYDSHRVAAAAIRNALSVLGATERALVHEIDALATPRASERPFDVIFIDPPFSSQLHAQALVAVDALIGPETRVYLEFPIAEQGAIESILAERFTMLRSKRAAHVGYCLARRAADSEDTGT